MSFSVKMVPNILTTLRMLLAIPIAVLIVKSQFSLVLWVAFIAGVTDALDGWMARKFNAVSRYGSIMDPLSDKVLMVFSYAAFTVAGLVPVWFMILIALRDILIVAGALLYHRFYGHYEMEPSVTGKLSTFVQILFGLILIITQIHTAFPEVVLQTLFVSVVAMVFVSGFNYLFVWGRKALSHRG